MKKGAPQPDISTRRSRQENAALREIHRVPGCGDGSGGRRQHQRDAEELGHRRTNRAEAQACRGSGPGGAGGGTLVSAMVAKGEAEIGMTFSSEMNDPGIDIVGTLPKEVSPLDASGGLRLRSCEKSGSAPRRCCNIFPRQKRWRLTQPWGWSQVSESGGGP